MDVFNSIHREKERCGAVPAHQFPFQTQIIRMYPRGFFHSIAANGYR